MHLVNGQYHVYFSMRMNPGVMPGGERGLALGVATSPSPFGPFVDLGRPLRRHRDGIIDTTWFRDPTLVLAHSGLPFINIVEVF